MSVDKYPCIFLRQMAAIVYLLKIEIHGSEVKASL